MLKRASGVLMHVSSLPGKYGCGDFGDGARAWVDFLSSARFSYWQTLPFCVPDEYNSPYCSYSTFSGNPNFIDLERLYARGLLTQDELDASKQKTPYLCEFDRLRTQRMDILRLAASRVDAEERRKINDFVEVRPYIERFCRFMALKKSNDGVPWQLWSNTCPDSEEEFAWRFAQYEFFEEWRELKAYANERGVRVIGDVPIYVSLDSADVWGDRGQFLLDSDGYPRLLAGVPPDYFSADGQLWGNPIYDWNVAAADGYRFWRDRLTFMLEIFDGVRLDHFRAFESYYVVPREAKSAREGKWLPGPGKPFIDMVRDIAGEKLIIAEDLGDITPKVEKLLEYSGFPGMRVLQFGFLTGDDSPHRPHNYPVNCVAYTGTHDNNTLLGYIWEMPPERRRDLFDYCGCPDYDWNLACRRALLSVMASSAALAIFPVQDLLCYGADTRMNTPGVAEKNWAFRLTDEQLSLLDPAYWRRMNILYGRQQS